MKNMYNQKLSTIKSSIQTFPSINRNLFPVILGLIGASIIILSTSRFNVGVTSDSVAYISAARNIASGRGMTSMIGSPITAEPPLYPIVLAVVNYVFKIDPLLSVRFINALLFGLIIYLSGLLFTMHLKSSPVLVLLGTVYVLVSRSLVDISLYAWTEALFVCFVLLYILFSEKYIEKRDTTSLVLLSLFTSLASLTRYIGIVLIPVGVIYILFFNQDNLAIKIRHFFLFGSISILPITAYFIRNYILSGSLMSYNPMPFGENTFYEGVSNIYHMANTMFDNVLSWFIPKRIVVRPFFIMSLIFVIGFIVFLAYKGNSKKLSNLLPIYPILLFVAAYTGSLLLILGIHNHIEDRYLSPIFVPTILVLLILAEKLMKPLLGRLFPKYANILFVAVMVVGLVYPTYAMIQRTVYQMETGSGYTSETWNNSETIQYLLHHQSLESECAIYTNSKDAIFLLTGLKTKSSPRNELKGGASDISVLEGAWPLESNICLVWFDNITWRDYLFSPEELMLIVNVEGTTQLQDGTIYYFSKK